ncbi:DEAD/DEAH box helicase [Laribacter hongkongensis]|uniref:DEAD/DEAH box helicase n=1 Tax=Laribacter hongkongensis TaxID=168471 RepID=UPI001EFD9A98|nr:DEAD/DEAH box helicase [Laribacter hongkongensis]MCG9053992.1 DEAD/DEAH box helicase [Laribacter hongkongensis]
MQTNAFAALGLDARLVHALEQHNITTPTPVQAEALPLLLSGRDLMASAQTGTGKTAAFLLPALSRLLVEPVARSRGPRVLVLAPTRELVQQVAKAAQEFSTKIPRVNVASVIGGTSFRTQNQMLTRPIEVMVATPGRLMDQMRSGRIDFSRLEMLVLDEADRMLDMGFSEDVMEIASQLPKARQTAFFTATMTRRVLDFADELLTEPAKIEIAAQTAKHENIEQQAIFVDDIDHKRRLVRHILSQPDVKQAIVFVATKRDCDTLADELIVDGIRADALHGDMQQRDRTRTLTRLRSGQTEVLVATDVAARGIDVAGISHVINFDLPRFAEDYVHRVGRTGRAGATGTAVSLVGRQDAFPLKKIERFTGQKLIVTEIEGMIARFKPQERREGGGGRGGFGGKPRHGNGQGRSYGDRSSAPRGGFGGHQQRREGGDDRRQFAPRQDGDAHRSGTARDGRRFDDRSSAPRGDFAPRGDRGHSWGQQRDDRRPHGGGQSREGGFRNGDRPRQGGNRSHGGRYGD